jgi:hypothetical protein
MAGADPHGEPGAADARCAALPQARWAAAWTTRWATSTRCTSSRTCASACGARATSCACCGPAPRASCPTTRAWGGRRPVRRRRVCRQALLPCYVELSCVHPALGSARSLRSACACGVQARGPRVRAGASGGWRDGQLARTALEHRGHAHAIRRAGVDFEPAHGCGPEWVVCWDPCALRVGIDAGSGLVMLGESRGVEGIVVAVCVL